MPKDAREAVVTLKDTNTYISLEICYKVLLDGDKKQFDGGQHQC